MKILLSVCRVSLLWSEWHQLHQILTHCDYESQHTQMMLLLMFSIENGENWEQLWENRTGKYTQNSLMEHNSCPLLPGKCLLHILMKLVTIEFSHKKELRLKGINLQRESGFTIPSYLKWTYHAQICQKKKINSLVPAWDYYSLLTLWDSTEKWEALFGQRKIGQRQKWNP